MPVAGEPRREAVLPSASVVAVATSARTRRRTGSGGPRARRSGRAPAGRRSPPSRSPGGARRTASRSGATSMLDGRGGLRGRARRAEHEGGQKHRAHRSGEGSGAARVRPLCSVPAAPATPCRARASVSSPRRRGWRPTRCSSTSRTPSRRAEKERARELVIAALREQDFGAGTVVVRVNGTDTPHYYRDLIDVVEQAGDRLDAVMLPKVRTPGRRRDDRQAARADRAGARAGGRQDRDRGPDRGRHRAARLRGDRRRLAADGERWSSAPATTAPPSGSRSRRSAARPSTTPATT